MNGGCKERGTRVNHCTDLSTMIVRKIDSQHCTVRTSETDCYLFCVVSHVSDTYDTDVLSIILFVGTGRDLSPI